ncbi:phosphatidate cytidylyltransferase, mitochondrial-like [Cyclospora cayetanensis]|uniref:Phosphatidate cytidylyltransferase, mitochondrial n=1 Tax=Cyclospora cayetanensis TaxID=88456 RepID=A0A6P6S2Y3_9EIME|nr:phosphatidate cytidylyltransferase, mitochondrial-like [Cyclospora cayetanensis]
MRGQVPDFPTSIRGESSTALLPELPPIEACIFYGSNFFPQRPLERRQQDSHGEPKRGQRPEGELSSSSRNSSPLYDMLLLVPQQQLLQWHADNFSHRPEHYAPFIRHVARYTGGGKRVAAAFAMRLTEASEVPVLYNCRVPLNNHPHELCKYGVVPTEAFCEDLRLWKHFYFAGRMQKPVNLCWKGADQGRRAQVEGACLLNRLNALRLALLLLPQEVSLMRLLEEIVSLSYQGDFRMLVAEDPQKVQAIVRSQTEALCSIYLPLLSRLPSVHLEAGEHVAVHGEGPLPFGEDCKPQDLKICNVRVQGSTDGAATAGKVLWSFLYVQQDKASPAALEALYSPLPLSIRQRAEAGLNSTSASDRSSSSVCRYSQPSTPPPAEALRLGLQRLMLWPTLKCSMKNAVSAGLVNSVLYGLRKLGKRVGK